MNRTDTDTVFSKVDRSRRLQDIRKFGITSMAYSQLQDDIKEFRHAEFEGFIGYTNIGNCHFILSNPITAPVDYQKATRLFLEKNPYTVVCEADETYAQILRNCGFYLTGCGVENSIDLESFVVSNRVLPNLHRFFTRVKNLGFSVQEGRGSLHELQGLNSQWLAQRQNKREFRFLARPFVSNAEEEVKFFLLKKGEELFGFCSFDPIYSVRQDQGIDSYVLQHIRVIGSAPKGAADFLVISILGMLKAQGCRRASLGLSLLHQRYKPLTGRDFLIEFLLDFFYNHSNLYKCKTISEHKDRYHAHKAHAYLAFSRRRDIKGVFYLVKVNGLSG